VKNEYFVIVRDFKKWNRHSYRYFIAYRMSGNSEFIASLLLPLQWSGYSEFIVPLLSIYSRHSRFNQSPSLVMLAALRYGEDFERAEQQ